MPIGLMEFKEIVERAHKDEDFFSSRINNQISLAKSLNPKLNAFTSFIEGASRAVGSLSGLTFAVKDIIECDNTALSAGLSPPIISNSQHDAEIVRLLKSLGASPLGKSNLDPLALGSSGENQFYGNVKNSRDINYPIGGSSAGSASAVAASICDFAIGTDHGGSTRIPAANCGLSAIKLTSGYVSKKGCKVYSDSIDSLGFMTTTVSDLNYLVSSLKAPSTDKIKINKVLLPCKEDLSYLSPKTQLNFRDTIERLGKKIEVLELKDPLGFEHAQSVRKIIITKLFAAFIDQHQIDPKIIHPEGLALLEFSKSIDEETLETAFSMRSKIKENLMNAVPSESSAICTPTFSDETFPESPTKYIYMTLANVCDLAALVIPVGNEKIPFSIQLMGFDEIGLLEAGIIF